VTDKYTISLPIFDYCLSANGRHEVNQTSALEIREALEKFARYFKAEFRYDHVQYHADEHDKNCIGFLFTESALDVCSDEHIEMPTRCSGGVCFRKVIFSDGEKWILYWVWLHPFFRDLGILSRHWQYFRTQFNDFIVEPPLSSAMQSFLEKQNQKASLPNATKLRR
jgi:hypothetical protein